VPPARRKPALKGYTKPLHYTKPLRPLTRKTTRGFEIIDFARDVVGEPLLPWQEFVVKSAFELLPSGRYRFRTVLIVVARQNGKSHLLRIITLWRAYVDGARQILGTAHRVGLARKQWTLVQRAIKTVPELASEWEGVRNVNGDEKCWFAGCEYEIMAGGDAGRGASNDLVVIDELRVQSNWKTWAAVSKTTSARRNGQTWAMSNAGDDYSIVLNQLQEVGRNGTDPSLCLLEWSAPDGCELDDPAAICQANPSIGYDVGLSQEAIWSALGTDPPAIYRTEVLCQRVPNLDAAIDLGAWRDCADDAGNLTALKGRIALCFDAAEDGQHATLAAAAQTDDGRVRVEIVKAWKSTEDARSDLDGLFDTIKARAIGWYPSGPGAALGPVIRKRGKQLEIGGTKAGEACQNLADLVRGRQIIHPADPLLDAHIAAATKLHTGDGWRFVRKDAGHVDAAYAAAGAIYAAQTLPAPRRPQIRILGA
jgi:hypothetical protein